MLLQYILYFFNCNLYIFYILYYFKHIIFNSIIIIQVLIKFSKLFCTNILIKIRFILDHSPKPSGLIFKHVWSLFSKLQTCFLTSFKIIFCSCNATCVLFTLYPSFPVHFSFCCSTVLIKPWGQRFAPFIGISWIGYFNFFYHPSMNRFLQ
jgi:hypothetical protein